MLQITAIEDKEDYSGNEYKKITFQELAEEDGVINAQPKTTIRNLWLDSFPAAATFVVGSKVFGKIVTKEVQPFKIGSSIINTYTAAILGKFETQEELRIEIEKTFNKLNVPLKKAAPTFGASPVNF